MTFLARHRWSHNTKKKGTPLPQIISSASSATAINKTLGLRPPGDRFHSELPEVESKETQIFCIFQQSPPNAHNLRRGHFCGLDKPEAFSSSSDLLPPAAGVSNKVLKAPGFSNLPPSPAVRRDSISRVAPSSLAVNGTATRGKKTQVGAPIYETKLPTALPSERRAGFSQAASQAENPRPARGCAGARSVLPPCGDLRTAPRPPSPSPRSPPAAAGRGRAG